MLTQCVFGACSRMVSKIGLDLRNIIKVGEKSESVKNISPLLTTNRSGIPGDDIVGTGPLIELIELQAAEMLEKRLDNKHASVGFFVDLNHKKPIHMGEFIKIITKVENVSQTKITFKASVMNPEGNIELGAGEHIRAIIPIQ